MSTSIERRLLQGGVMGNLPRTRKRVFGFPRAPDGSAFQKCESCGVSVAVALYDMHDCHLKLRFKRFRGNVKEIPEYKSSQESVKSEVLNHQPIEKTGLGDQPRSAFRFFMEGFKENHQNENHIDVETRGFETWKNMSTEEREKFIIEAGRVNSAYEKALIKEVDDTEVDDEADSAMVGKFDLSYEHWYDSDSSGSLYFDT